MYVGTSRVGSFPVSTLFRKALVVEKRYQPLARHKCTYRKCQKTIILLSPPLPSLRRCDSLRRRVAFMKQIVDKTLVLAEAHPERLLVVEV